MFIAERPARPSGPRNSIRSSLDKVERWPPSQPHLPTTLLEPRASCQLTPLTPGDVSARPDESERGYDGSSRIGRIPGSRSFQALLGELSLDFHQSRFSHAWSERPPVWRLRCNKHEFFIPRECIFVNIKKRNKRCVVSGGRIELPTLAL